METVQLISDKTLARIKSFILYDAGYVPVYTDPKVASGKVDKQYPIDAELFDELVDVMRRKAIVGNTTISVSGAFICTSEQTDHAALLYNLEQLIDITLKEKGDKRVTSKNQ